MPGPNGIALLIGRPRPKEGERKESPLREISNDLIGAVKNDSPDGVMDALKAAFMVMRNEES